MDTKAINLSERFQSLDIFRGMTVFFMIIVNSIPSEEIAYEPLLHAKWFGFTPTDLVFPSFLFAIGNALCFGAAKWTRMSAQVVYWKILKRSLLIFLVGYLMYWFPFFHLSHNGWALNPIEETRIFGVLQRIGVAFLISGLLIYHCREKTLVGVSVLILIAYHVVLYFFAIPGKDPLSLEGNAVLRLDLALFGASHLYQGEGIPFDPEALLSTFPSVVNVLIGYLVGNQILRHRTDNDRLLAISLYGFFLLVFGYLISYAFPVSKKLWTSSFVLISSGIDILLLLSLYYFIERKGRIRMVSEFLVFGRNPLAIYLFSQVFLTILYSIPVGQSDFYTDLFERCFMPLGGKAGCLLQAFIFTSICWGLGKFLDTKKIFIRL